MGAPADHPPPPPRDRPAGPPAWLDTAAGYSWRLLVVAAAAGAAALALAHLYLVVLPVVVAAVLATICVPPARRLEAMGLNRLAAASVVVIGGIAALAAVVAAVTPAFVRQARDLGPTVEAGVDRILVWLEEGPIGWDRDQVIGAISGIVTDEQFVSRAARLAGTVGEMLVGLVLTLVLLFFFVKDGPQLTGWVARHVAPRHRDTVAAVASRGWTSLGGFVRGTAIVALIDAVGIGLGLAVIGVPLVLPLMLAVFIGGFVPVVGAVVTGMLAVLVALAWGGLAPALAVLAVVVAVQQFESNVLQPVVMRRAVYLHPVVILSALTAGAVLGGIIGAFLAVPLTAVAAAVGNELRLRHQASAAGLTLSAAPIGGPKGTPAGS
jgi:predicted PurR-regulated permease PerM